MKVGNGSLTLKSANTDSGATTVNSGKLSVNNTTGSATGTGPVEVAGGKLGGTGTVAGAVTVASGGDPALLAPGNGSTPGTLTMQNSLIFAPTATYEVELDSSATVGDKVVAVGVTIQSGAQISLADLSSSVLPPGTIFAIIDNTAATAITGVFSNLADGSAVTVGSNTFQVDYQGGDGNDLTLAVVP